MAVLDNLLAKGYLPTQLPPAFSSESFAAGLPKFTGVWNAISPVPPTVPERYSVARSSFYRRNTAVVNPINFYFLAKEIDTYWPKIANHYSKSGLSRSVPTFEGTTLRAIKIKQFSELHEEKITSAAGFQYALITDISSFFPTIYTHTIPWALHSKDVAKTNRNKKTAQYFGNILDDASMSLQDRQTIGLPIGPDTSHIIAEIIAVAIDEQLTKELGRAPNGFRYVDDFYLFFNRREDADKALAATTRAVAAFELQINPAKTRIVEVKALVTESWKYSMKKLVVSERRKAQNNDLHHYFESLFSLAAKFNDESLVKYGLKQISSRIIKKSNWQVFEAYLLKCGFSFPNTLQIIAHILATYHFYNYPVNKQAIRRFCNTLIRSAAAVDHHGEVSWLLWICEELSLKLDVNAVRAVERMTSPVCMLLLLDLCNKGIVTVKLGQDPLKQYCVTDALYGADWMLAYEGGRREWLGNTNDKFITTDRFFGPLVAAGVEFFDEEKRLPPIFELKDPKKDVKKVDFDSDSSIDTLFTFDEIDEEYFDSSTAKDPDLGDADAETSDDSEQNDETDDF